MPRFGIFPFDSGATAPNRLERTLRAVVLAAALGGCAQNSVAVAPAVQRALSPPAASKIAHVVIIFQENRTPDNLFNDLPGADTVSYGVNSKGQRVKLAPESLTVPYDVGHSHVSFRIEKAGGEWNGFDRVDSRCFGLNWCLPRRLRAFGYVPHREVRPYFDLAEQYAFADRMFQTNQGPSFPAHQYIVSATSSVVNGSPYLAAENPSSPLTQPSGGCDAPPESLVLLIGPAGEERKNVYPCFDRISLMDLIAAKHLSWRYYQAYLGPGIWNGPDAIERIRDDPAQYANVIAPPAQVLTDVAHGKLASVTWVTPTPFASDHSAVTDGSGPSWVAAVVNAVGKSPFWNSTAIFITWDDWGGWYDHVVPPQYNPYELSFRVPLIVVSPFAKRHYVSHKQHEFGSILKFSEKIFGLGSMHATDERSDDLFDCFDFTQPPAKFHPIAAPLPPSYFLRQPISRDVPDSD